MKQIDLEIWNRTPENQLVYAGQRKAQEVFAEIKHHLENVGMLPDEYFLLDDAWENGKEIPKNAHIFSTVMYGESEGIYLDIGIRWDEDGKRNVKTFATGKTLGESESHLDRMYLTASAINKALYSNQPHARYMVIGGKEKVLEDSVFHLNNEERRILTDSLVERRNQLLDETKSTEQLLRRVVGSITEFVNEVGAKPLEISDFDLAILAVEDGNLAAFNEVYKKTPEKMGDILMCAAGRPGKVGYEMTLNIIANAQDIPYEAYLAACKNAISTGDTQRVLMLAEGCRIEGRIADFDKSFHGAIISVAMSQNQGKMPSELAKQCTSDEIRAANPYILAQALYGPYGPRDTQLVYALCEKKIDMTANAADVIRALKNHNNDWMLKHLFDCGMEMDNRKLSALALCVELGSVEMGKVLIDRGMDFGKYEKWAANDSNANDANETFSELKQYWTDTAAPEPELANAPPTPAKPEKTEKKDIASRLAEGKVMADAHNAARPTPDTPRRAAGTAEIT